MKIYKSNRKSSKSVYIQLDKSHRATIESDASKPNGYGVRFLNCAVGHYWPESDRLLSEKEVKKLPKVVRKLIESL